MFSRPPKIQKIQIWSKCVRKSANNRKNVDKLKQPSSQGFFRFSALSSYQETKDALGTRLFQNTLSFFPKHANYDNYFWSERLTRMTSESLENSLGSSKTQKREAIKLGGQKSGEGKQNKGTFFPIP